MSASELALSTDAPAQSALGSTAEGAPPAPEAAPSREDVPLAAPGSVEVFPAALRPSLHRAAARLRHGIPGAPASGPMLGFARGRAACRRSGALHVHAGVT